MDGECAPALLQLSVFVVVDILHVSSYLPVQGGKRLFLFPRSSSLSHQDSLLSFRSCHNLAAVLGARRLLLRVLV